MASNTTVYVGFWNNWSKEGMNKSTLTLSQTNGAVLIAALAIFIQLAGGQSWSIICFILHQARTTKIPKDGLYYQQQAVLRNAGSDAKTLWQITNLGMAWRSTSSAAIQRSVLLTLIGLAHLLSFVATGTLSSYITTVGDEVLVASTPTCGPWKADVYGWDPTPYGSQGDLAHGSSMKNSLKLGKRYVESCIKQGEVLPECERYKQRQLKWSARRNVSCPFQEMCLGPPNSSVFLSTDLLDSRDDFGVNAKNNERVQVKREAICSPVTTEGYSKNGSSWFDYSSLGGGHSRIPFNYTALFYGVPPENYTGQFGDLTLENATYIHMSLREAAGRYSSNLNGPYDIILLAFEPGEKPNPIPPFLFQNSTLSLVVVAFYGTYAGESNDLWLSAHKHTTIGSQLKGIGNIKRDAWVPDQSLMVLGCIDQIQFCNPLSKTPRCTEPEADGQISDYSSAKHNFEQIFDNEQQIATALALSTLGVTASISRVVGGVSLNNEEPLLASQLMNRRQSAAPSADQWILEIENWLQIGLAYWQRSLVEYISGVPPEYVKYLAFNSSTTEPGLKWLCENQIIRRRDFTNFSTLAIGLVFGLGGLVIVVSLCLETVVGWFRKIKRGGYWKQTVWWEESMLQIQRRAFEGVGVDGWVVKEWEKVPIMQNTKKWAMYGGTDEITSASTAQGSISLGDGVSDSHQLSPGSADSEVSNSPQTGMECPRVPDTQQTGPEEQPDLKGPGSQQPAHYHSHLEEVNGGRTSTHSVGVEPGNLVAQDGRPSVARSSTVHAGNVGRSSADVVRMHSV